MFAPHTAILAPTEPRGLRDPSVMTARRTLLQAEEHAPLRAFTECLRAEGPGIVPDLDPLDAGTSARALFLLEKPGPMTDATRKSERLGSGFVSRDNDDPTAEAIFHFMRQAEIERRQSLIWNVIPWWNGTRRIAAHELQSGLDALQGLIDILPNLRVIVLVGRKAARAAPALMATGLPVIQSAHPSPIVRASRREVWDRIPLQWAGAHEFLRILDE